MSTSLRNREATPLPRSPSIIISTYVRAIISGIETFVVYRTGEGLGGALATLCLWFEFKCFDYGLVLGELTGEIGVGRFEGVDSFLIASAGLFKRIDPLLVGKVSALERITLVDENFNFPLELVHILLLLATTLLCRDLKANVKV